MATKVKLIADNAITTTQIDTSSLDSHFSGGTGVTYSSGEISIGQAIATTDSPTFADLTLTGNLNITGDLNSYNVTDLDVTDQTITLGAGQTEELSGGSGIIVDGSGASILWDETNNEFDINKGINVTGTITADGLIVENTTPVIDVLAAVNEDASLRLRENGTGVVGAEFTYDGGDNQLYLKVGNNTNTKRLSVSRDTGDISFYEDTGTTAKFFWDASEERLGLGTTSPSSALDIQFADSTAYSATANNPSLEIGNINSSANTNFSSISMFTDGNGRGIVNLNALNNATAASADFSIQTRHNGTLGERLRITSSGNVGIGNSNPLQKFSVGGLINSDFNQDYYGAWMNGNSSTNGYSIMAVGEWYSAGLYIQKKTGENRTHIYNYNASHPLIINAGSSTHGETTSSKSRLGIGTFSPNAVVHIQGQNPAGLIVENGAGIASTQPYVSMAANDFSSGSGTFRWEDQRASQASPSFIWEVHDGTGTTLAYDFRTGATGAAGSKLAITQSGNVGIGAISPTQKLEVSGTALVDNAKLKAIAESNTDTAVDVFVYDTRKDSDGGAWRKRTQHTSWYNETLNTSTRGARREFPCVAVIICTTNTMKIYDGDDPELPMWMVFSPGGIIDWPTSTHSRLIVSALNGGIVVVSEDGGEWFRFIDDTTHIIYSSLTYNITSDRSIANRNGTTSYTNTGSAVNTYAVATYAMNDVDMTVLPNAPIDDATGLPTPTIAVATDAGVSVIKDDGKVVTITGTSSVYNYWDKVKFTKDHKLIIQANYQNISNQLTHVIDFPVQDGSFGQVNAAYTELNGRYYHGDSCNPRISTSSFKPEVVSMEIDLFAMGHKTELNGGVNLIAEEPATVSGTTSDAALCFIEHDFNTGWMVGDTRLASLSDTDTTSISSSGNTNILSGSSWVNNSSFPYETFTTSGLDITSAINTTAYGAANLTWSATAGETYTAYFNLTLNSGTAPTLYVQTSSSFGNGISYQTVNGANSFTFRADRSTSSYFSFSVQNGVATNFSVSNLELYQGGVANRVQDPLEANISSYPGFSVVGTINKSAVASGAELVGYTPNGAPSSNHLYIKDPKWSIGTGDFTISFWSYSTTSGDTEQLYLGNPSSSGASPSNGFNIWTYGGYQKMYISGDYVQYPDLGQNVWICKTFVRRTGRLYLYENGSLKTSISSTGSINDQTFYVFWGHYAQSSVATSMALLRISKTPATVKQIERMYNDEKHLFQPNAAATIAGSSNTVTALAYDDDKKLLHVGSSSGRSVFEGLRRVEYSTDVIGAAISASNGFIVEE